MAKYRVHAVETRYWAPGTDYVQQIIDGVREKVEDDDFVVISEKAVSTALGNIIDENSVKPTLNSKLIARFWMRTVWGYVLGPLCRLKPTFIQHLREYPCGMGSRHKQVALEHYGLFQALMFGSEGGIDASNLAYSYVSLPLKGADRTAQQIRRSLLEELHKRVAVMIADTDKTYSFENFHFTPLPNPIRGIHSLGGFLAYVVGRLLRLKRRATPLAIAGAQLPPEDALQIAEIANRARGFGAGRNVWDMADGFRVPLTGVTWEMLNTVRHKPIVILRSKRRKGDGRDDQKA
jgi:F420-0:gamma-glutamyl ligase-like protein